ncbi:MAG: DUF3560 domain-containing protein [Solirubrobacteraceae bacterium]
MTTDTPRTHRKRREAHAERLRTWAASRERRSATSAASVDALASTIPLGQPILVGHHSQRRAERDRERIERGTRRTIEHTDKARAFRQRAENIDAAAARAVYSDDPDAIGKLRERLAELEGERDTIKAYNAAARKGRPIPPRWRTSSRASLMQRCARGARASVQKVSFPATCSAISQQTSPATSGGLHHSQKESAPDD